MRILIATGKDYALPVMLSDEDYEWAIAQGNWFVTHGKRLEQRKGPMTSGYAVRSVRQGTRWGLLWLHKEVLRRAVGEPPTPAHKIGDHINGDRLNNQRHNLRWATHQMNARNLHGFAAKQGDLFHGFVPSN